jgi:hypothetical protein
VFNPSLVLIFLGNLGNTTNLVGLFISSCFVQAASCLSTRETWTSVTLGQGNKAVGRVTTSSVVYTSITQSTIQTNN